MVSTENKNIVEKLKRINGHVQVATNTQIAIRYTVEFVGNYFLEEILKMVVQGILTTGREEHVFLDELDKKTNKDVDGAIKKIIAYISTTKMLKSATDSIIKEQLNDLKKEKPAIESLQWPIEIRYHGLCNILLLLAIDSGDTPTHHEFVKQFTSDIVVDKGILRIRNFDFSPSFAKWRIERDRLSRICKTQVWYCWNEIALIYFAHQYREQLIDKYTSTQCKDYFDELKNIMTFGDQKQPSLNFGLSQIKYCVQKVFDLTYDCLFIEESDAVQDEESSDEIEKPNYKWSCNPDTKTFYAPNGERAKFRAGKRPLAILAIITKNNRAIKKKWWFDELYNKVMGLEPEQGDTKMYDACLQINNLIKEKTEMLDFLVFDTFSVRINTDYLN